jgi:RND family efflux transporter MFP subunit
MSRHSKPKLIATLLGWLPSGAVLVLLGCIGWYGHHNDWKLPSLTKNSGNPDAMDPAWCDSHGVPESICIVCDESIIGPPPSLSFCKTHGVHGCVFDHPALAETKTPTTPTSEDLRRAKEALSLMPRTENIPIGSAAGSRIQFVSIEAMNRAGVDVEPVTRTAIVESIEVAGEILYDATRTAAVSPPADGVVRIILVKVGQWVREGEPLAVVDSEAIGRLKTELSAARANQELAKETVTRLEPLAGTAISGKRLLEAKNNLKQADADIDRVISALANLGVNADEESFPKESSNEVVVTAPLDGRVTDVTTTIGSVVDRGSLLFRVIDTRHVWLDLRVPAEKAPLVSEGQVARYQPDGLAEPREGAVTFISTDVDQKTRTVRVRAELENTDGSLRNESFGRGQIVLRQAADAIVVPEEALQWDGSTHLVFVRDARFFEKDRPKFFVARSVRPGVRTDGKIEMIAGVLPGEVVVSKGSDVLRAQLLRSNLGAGCTCGH